MHRPGAERIDEPSVWVGTEARPGMAGLECTVVDRVCYVVSVLGSG